jgi:hypothetical protein
MFRISAAAVVTLTLLAVGWFVMTRSGTTPAPGTSSAQAQDQFASNRPAATSPLPFDGKRAMTYLKQICDIGPRISGSEGMTQQIALLRKHFEALGGKIELQKFDALQRSQGQATPMTNLIVSWFPERRRRVLFCCHYDTRPFADEETDERRRNGRFISANDGGSGVAWLMELAHHMKDFKGEVGVDFVIFDGEEFVFDREDKYFFGSQHFAQAYRKRGEQGPRYVAGILLDMMGGKNPEFPVDQHSWQLAEGLVREVWQTAAELKCDLFVERMGRYAVEDDHIALNRIAGIPTIDIIDFSYKHWHRLSDTPEQCSADTLEQVARVLTVWAQRTR